MQKSSELKWTDSSFPHKKLLVMAFFDTIQFSGLLVSAAGIPPTMTVILLHANTPFVVLGSRVMFEGRLYSENQMRGVLLITAAVVINFYRPINHFLHDDNVSFISSAISYVVFVAFQGFAMLYKEKCIIAYGKPLDVHELSFWLFLYQSGITIVLSPLIYIFQGLMPFFFSFIY